MSGGVDSSSAAALLKDEGYEVIGVSLNFITCDRPIERSCCSAKDREDARKVCEKLGIKHFVVDCRSLFKESVIGPFVDEYVQGRTPSPCIHCNERMKFPVLAREAKKLNAPFIATGHYARISREGGVTRLLKASDPAKDQSYFLFGMTKTELEMTLFPLGELTKKEVRKIAKSKGLVTSAKAESQEICFVPDDDYAEFVERSAGARLSGPGDFKNANGEVVGRHRGIHAYTIGQRRGLCVSASERQYVVRIDPEKNEIILGDDVKKDEITVRGVTWINGNTPDTKDVVVKIRSTHAGSRAAIDKIAGGRLRVNFKEPVRAPAPGQAAVFYRGDEVLGGGWIE